ncbi:integral membrane protein [Fusarium pseudoanthophilum]|uniref:Integral membrane protein n=1 Tax=Fusarium pseudoanthophilum TaxID=48495 RepID=A0A8H5PPH8_9HYPO|nr:integral membrane protein [Fusarium pseudoanthophilum]
MRPSHANIGFWLMWFAALLWSYHNSYDDPSSFFYKSRIAFDRRYSALREKQVDEYLEREIFPVAHKQRTEVQVDNEFLCIGIPSINRTTSGFLAHTVGSLVDSLTPNERNQIHIVVLLADKDPTRHFAYGKGWLFGLADDVLVYSNDSKTESKLNYKVLPHDVRGMGRSDDRVENIRLDHSVLFEACRRRDPTYFALIEDDIIATPDWFTRFKKGVMEVEQKATDAHQDWMYLRLFYSEIFMGWNNEEIFDYLKVVILGYTALIACLLLALRCRQRRHAGSFATKDFAQTVALLLGLWIPACLALAFVTGRITLHRLFTRSPTVREMPRYGCCAQGLVFPNHHLQNLQDFLREPPFQFPGDMIMEDYARDNGLSKWALDPSVLQHVGLVESSDGPRRAEVWNFSFERLKGSLA